MDPHTAMLALGLQLSDVDAVLAGLPPTKDGGKNSESAVFAAHCDDSVSKWEEVQGRAFAYGVLKEENNNFTVFQRLLAEERQAEGACICVGGLMVLMLGRRS